MFLKQIFFITRSPEQYQNYFFAEEGFKKISEKESGTVCFDDM